MEHAEATEMIATMRIAPGPQVWADLGCGTGTFTRALAGLLPVGSTIHAVDTDAAALRSLSLEDERVTLRTHRADFTAATFALQDLHGILMANALHFVKDQAGFLARAGHWMKPGAPFLFIEYDTATPNPPWVPYPVPFHALGARFPGRAVVGLHQRPSVFGRAMLYAAQVR